MSHATLETGQCSVADGGIERCTPADIRAILQAGRPPSRRTYIARVAEPGATNLQYVPSHDPAPDDFKDTFSSQLYHEWGAEYVALIDHPLYVIPSIGTCVALDGRVFAETLYAGMGRHELDALLAHRDLPGLASLLRLDTDASFQQRIVAPVLSAWSQVYFHMLSECLTVADLLATMGFADACDPVLPDRLFGAQGIVAGQVAARTVRPGHPVILARGALICSGLYRHAALGTLYADAMRRLRANILGGGHPERGFVGSAGCEKLFVSRAGAAARPLRNDAAVEELVRLRGYQVVRPDRMAFADQVRRFASASVILGAHGAGLANAAFAPSHSILFELRQLNRIGESPMWNSSYRKLSGAMGLRYGFDVSANPPGDDAWEIDIGRLARCLDHLEAHIPTYPSPVPATTCFDQVYRGGSRAGGER